MPEFMDHVVPLPPKFIDHFAIPTLKFEDRNIPLLPKYMLLTYLLIFRLGKLENLFVLLLD